MYQLCQSDYGQIRKKSAGSRYQESYWIRKKRSYHSISGRIVYAGHTGLFNFHRNCTIGAVFFFNQLTGSKISIPFSNGLFWLLMVCFVCITTRAAGSRPAFYLSSFNPVRVLKGTLHIGREASLPRKVLVVLQFSCSIALIISTLIVYKQIQYAKNRPSGYDLTRIMMTGMSEDLVRNYTALKNELLEKGIA